MITSSAEAKLMRDHACNALRGAAQVIGPALDLLGSVPGIQQRSAKQVAESG
jgi:hypothetical protein